MPFDEETTRSETKGPIVIYSERSDGQEWVGQIPALPKHQISPQEEPAGQSTPKRVTMNQLILNMNYTGSTFPRPSLALPYPRSLSFSFVRDPLEELPLASFFDSPTPDFRPSSTTTPDSFHSEPLYCVSSLYELTISSDGRREGAEMSGGCKIEEEAKKQERNRDESEWNVSS